MNKTKKLLDKMDNCPQGDWTISQLKTLADKLEIDYRQHGTSHVTFRDRRGEKITIPAHKPIKSVYIKHFLEFIREVEHGK